MPTQLKLLRGRTHHGPLGHPGEPQPALLPEVPEAPPFLTGYAQDEWYRVADELYHLKLLTLLDINPLAAYCDAYAIWRTAVETQAALAAADPVFHGLVSTTQIGTLAKSLVLQVIRNAAQDMVRYAAEFGLTPAARTRISAGDSDGPPSKFGPLIVN